MSLTKRVEITPIICITPSKGIEICPIDATRVLEYQIPSSHETNLVYIAPNTIEDLFVHRSQTDQLLVVKGKAILAILQNGCYQYILMSDRDLKVAKIPPGVPHGAINLTSEPCVAINSVIRHGAAHPRDYQPVPTRIPYNLEMAKALLEAN